MKIPKDTLRRQQWYKELWEKTLEEFKDQEIARIVFRRLVFEEK